MVDRAPTKPNRYAVYDDSHNFIRYEYHERADEPTQVGDALNKANLLPDDVATALGLTGNPQVKDALEKLSSAALRKATETRTPVAISTLNVDETYTIDDTEFLVIADNHYMANSKLLILKSATEATVAFSASSNQYENGSLDDFCNNSFLGQLPESFRQLIQPVEIISNGTTLTRKAFSLSVTELGLPASAALVEGTAIPYFASDALRAAADGIPYFTRTAATSDANRVFQVSSSGNRGVVSNYTDSRCARPAIVLKDDDTLYCANNGSYYTEQDYSNSLTDASGNDFPLPYAKIATGSYTGTGVYGSGNANSLIFGFKPQVVFVFMPEIGTLGFVSSSATRGGVHVQRFMRPMASLRTNTGYNYLTWLEDAIAWYNTEEADEQLNKSGQIYHYIAIG